MGAPDRTEATSGEARRADPTARLTAMFEAHYPFVWRSLRRLGVPSAAADDAAQEVFIVATRRIDTIEVHAERSFLFGTAVRVASNARRAARRRPPMTDDEVLREIPDDKPDASELTERRRATAKLDLALTRMPTDLRAVFILFEIEQMTLTEIAACLSIPRGTAASRLRRSRTVFFEVTRGIAQ